MGTGSQEHPLAQSFKPPARVLETINANIRDIARETGRGDVDIDDARCAFRFSPDHTVQMRVTFYTNTGHTFSVSFDTPVQAACLADGSGPGH